MRSSSENSKNMRVALVVPHIFMHREILPRVIFSPGHLALSLADNLVKQGVSVTLFTPGQVETKARNITADLSLFERELAGRGDNYLDLLKKHPFTFITLARQVQSELVTKAYALANDDEFDIVHIYTNEEEIALPFASLCRKPVIFTHHDPFNFLVKYKNNLPKYKHLNWISLSLAQRQSMPNDTNWVGNIYHGLDDPELSPVKKPSGDFVAFLGRLIEPKGAHLAIAAVKKYNQIATKPLKLRIAGKHYAEESKDTYWQTKILPGLDDPNIFYDGFIENSRTKRNLLANARALLVPSLFEEPFGMVTVEAFACGTPVVALDSGALPEVVEDGKTGFIISKTLNWNERIDETAAVSQLATKIGQLDSLNRTDCREAYEKRFTADQMAIGYRDVYNQLHQNS